MRPASVLVVAGPLLVLCATGAVATLRAVGPYYPTLHHGRPVLGRCQSAPSTGLRECNATDEVDDWYPLHWEKPLDGGVLIVDFDDFEPAECRLKSAGVSRAMSRCDCCEVLFLSTPCSGCDDPRYGR